MSTTMSLRVDEATQREIAELAGPERSRNAAIVEAIHEAYRRSLYAQMHQDSEALRTDSDYQTEVRAAREDMGADRAW